MKTKKPYIQPFRDKAGLWRLRIRAGGNNKVLLSGEAYSSWRKCIKTLVLLHGATGLSIDFTEADACGVLGRTRISDLE